LRRYVKHVQKWSATSRKKYLGLHVTEEAAALACSNYSEHGVVPEKKPR
jgi:hypothetical protein